MGAGSQPAKNKMARKPHMLDAKDTNAASPAEEIVDEPSESSTDEAQEEVKEQPQEDFYKAELQKYKKLADKRLDALKRIDQTKAEKVEKDIQSEDQTEFPDVDELVSKKFEAFKREQTRDEVDAALDEFTNSKDERELVEMIYENDIKPSGFSSMAIKRDVKKALLLANQARFEDELLEKAKQQVKKDLAETKNMTESSTKGGSGRKPPEAPKEKMTPRERKFMDYMESRLQNKKNEKTLKT
jgi:hypothetical protein